AVDDHASSHRLLGQTMVGSLALAHGLDVLEAGADLPPLVAELAPAFEAGLDGSGALAPELDRQQGHQANGEVRRPRVGGGQSGIEKLSGRSVAVAEVGSPATGLCAGVLNGQPADEAVAATEVEHMLVRREPGPRVRGEPASIKDIGGEHDVEAPQAGHDDK